MMLAMIANCRNVIKTKTPVIWSLDIVIWPLHVVIWPESFNGTVKLLITGLREVLFFAYLL